NFESETATRMLHAAIQADDIVGVTEALAASPHEVNTVNTISVLRNQLPQGILPLLSEIRELDKSNKDNEDPIELEGTPLLIAMYLGRADVVALLIACDNVDVNAANQDNDTPLGLACALGASDLVQVLLARPQIQPNVTNKLGQSPLHVATIQGHSELVRLLLTHAMVDVNQRCDFKKPAKWRVTSTAQSGCSALFIAAQSGFVDIVDILLPLADLVAATTADKWTPLMAAIMGKKCDVGLRERKDTVALRLLACSKVVETINNVDSKGRTPLLFAVMADSIPLVSALIAFPHIDLDMKSDVLSTHNTAIKCAARDGKDEILKLVLNRTTNINSIVEAYNEACENVDWNKAKMIFDHLLGDETVRTKFLEQVLLTTVRHGHAKMMAYIMDHPRFSAKEMDPGGEWAHLRVLHYACNWEGNENIVRVLIEKGMDVNATDKEVSSSPLEVASSFGCLDIVRVILLSPNFNRSDNVIQSLVSACQSGNTDIALALLEMPNIVVKGSKYAFEAMDEAVKHNMFQVVEALIAFGVPFEIIFQSKPLLAHVAPFLRVETAIKMLMRDIPFEVREKRYLNPRENHSYSWNIFLDSSTPVPPSVRLETVISIVQQDMFENCRHEFIHEIAFLQDPNGRSVLQTTDVATRKYFNDELFFCGRYEMYDGPPIHVSSTAVVVHAFDHGIFKQLFDHYAVNGSLRRDDFAACAPILGQKKSHVSAKEIVSSDFDIYDKNTSGLLTEVEFNHYCEQKFGSKLRVAMKFMRNRDEYNREIEMRNGLNKTQSVVELLPMASDKDFHSNTQHLTLHGHLNMTQYPHVLVMPLADRSLEDIYLKERPNDNQIRNLLQEIAELVKDLHERNIIHGDLKKLNVLRVDSHMRLIDMDAAAKVGHDVGAKFSSGNLPPELFYRLKDDKEENMYTDYWKEMVVSNPELWEKVKPRHSWVVKTYYPSCELSDSLPYKLAKASPAMDMWAFGVMMYQLYSGVELVPTNRNQDVDESGIERAATWTKDDLSTRIQNKVSNPLVRDLLSKLLVVDPNDRISAKAMLSHAYFDIKFDPNTSKVLQAMDSKLVQLSTQVATGFEQLIERFDQVVELNKATLEALGSAKEDLMRGKFQATEVHVPTSFVLLPFNILDKQDDDEDAAAVTIEQTANFIGRAVGLGNSFMKAIKANKVIGTTIKVFSAGEPLYLYLIDEVQGIPVVPPRLPEDNPPLYPIKIETKSDEYISFMTTAMPYIQTGFKFLKGINTVATLAKSLGVPSLDKEVLSNIGDNIEKSKKASSVFDFRVLQAAVEAHDKAAPVHNIRGAALRELERFFAQNDKSKDFSGLGRTYAASGQVLWTTKETIE
ncbi:hypothetical protein As57867_003749, partial [Aphanomyces stellatus]